MKGVIDAAEQKDDEGTVLSAVPHTYFLFYSVPVSESTRSYLWSQLLCLIWGAVSPGANHLPSLLAPAWTLQSNNAREQRCKPRSAMCYHLLWKCFFHSYLNEMMLDTIAAHVVSSRLPSSWPWLQAGLSDHSVCQWPPDLFVPL